MPNLVLTYYSPVERAIHGFDRRDELFYTVDKKKFNVHTEDNFYQCVKYFGYQKKVEEEYAQMKDKDLHYIVDFNWRIVSK